LCACKYFAEAQELKNLLRVRRKGEAQEGQHFYTHNEAQSVNSSQRRRKAKVEDSGRLKFFQVSEENVEAQEEQHQPLDQVKTHGI
jgi:hypothetical protein